VSITGIERQPIDEGGMKVNGTGKSRHLLITVFLVLIVGGLLIALSMKGQNSSFQLVGQSRIKTGSPAPNFTFPDLAGKKVSLSDYRGRAVFLNIWATWCPPCADEMPSMEKLYNQFKGHQFEILAVSIDGEGSKVVAPFMERLNLTFLALLDKKGKIRNIYGVTGIPESFIIDKNGIIIKKVIGPLDWAKPDVSRFFEELLQTPRS
jgi:cytochrome c biogenesis protein CcmG/thiol:disulfide interchange protein DsbE